MTLSVLLIGVASIAAAVLFVIGLHLMRTPSTARRGNLISATGMTLVLLVIVIVAALVSGGSILGWIALTLGVAIGSIFGAIRARTVKMTDVPQLVSLFNAVGGGAAAVIGFVDFMTAGNAGVVVSVFVVLDVLIGSVTFAGSLIASGKLQGIVPGRPLTFPGSRALNVLVVVIALGAAVATIILPPSVPLLT